ncbi:MAG TPA: choice-of-anchor tandem repeat GloVer-containing protein [Candidatus Tumulicola sp.]
MGSTYKVVYSFKRHRDGANPTGELVTLGNALYGVTYSGGNEYGTLGTVYKVSDGGKEAVLHRFAGGADGANPNRSGLINVNGTLYGATGTGGNGCSVGCGTIYSITAGGAERVLYALRGGSKGAGPTGPLISFDGALYGTAQVGGTSGCRGYGCGVIFKIGRDGSGYRVIHRFAGGVTDGAEPVSGLTGLAGKLYGTTYDGGSGKCDGGCGIVFEIGPSGGERVLYAFKGGRDGSHPDAGLIDVGGVLYGTTQEGGAAGCVLRRCGTIFEISTSGAERVIYRFKGGATDGASPQAPLLYVNGTFYGTTEFGGHCYDYEVGCGTIFAWYGPGKEKMLHAFGGGLDGSLPDGGMTALGSWLFGTTSDGGGSYNCGRIGCGAIFNVSSV